MHHLTVAEVANRLGVKPSKVKQFIESGQLKAIQIPTDKYDSYRTSEEWYSQFVESLRVQVKPQKPKRKPRRRKRDDDGVIAFFPVAS